MKIISRQVSVLAGSTCQFQGEDRGIKLTCYTTCVLNNPNMSMFLIVCVYLQGLIITYVFQSAYLCDGRFCCF